MRVLTVEEIDRELDKALDDYFEGCECQQTNCHHERRIDAALETYWLVHHRSRKEPLQ